MELFKKFLFDCDLHTKIEYRLLTTDLKLFKIDLFVIVQTQPPFDTITL